MRKYRRAERRRSLIKTVLGCVGWGLLGYVVMTTYTELFWLGWSILLVSFCIGAGSVDKYMECTREGY